VDELAFLAGVSLLVGEGGDEVFLEGLVQVRVVVHVGTNHRDLVVGLALVPRLVDVLEDEAQSEERGHGEDFVPAVVDQAGAGLLAELVAVLPSGSSSQCIR
jgi:hypothetical protein